MGNDGSMMDGAPRCVADLCHGIATRDFDLVAAQLAPDARWTIVGRPDRFPYGGPQTREQFIAGISASLPHFHQYSFDVRSWAANGDTVFVEAKSNGIGPGTATYDNLYLMRFMLRDGLVVDVLEHYDPFEALAYVEQLGN